MLEVGAHEGLTAAKVDLEDPGLMDLFDQCQGFGGGQFLQSRLSRSGETVTATQITEKGDLPGQIDRRAQSLFNKAVAHGGTPFPVVLS